MKTNKQGMFMDYQNERNPCRSNGEIEFFLIGQHKKMHGYFTDYSNDALIITWEQNDKTKESNVQKTKKVLSRQDEIGRAHV